MNHNVDTMRSVNYLRMDIFRLQQIQSFYIQAIFQPYVSGFYKENTHHPDELPKAPSQTFEEIRDSLQHENSGKIYKGS